MTDDSSEQLAGDQLPVAAAECSRDVRRSGETPAKFGGDEFVVLDTDTDSEGAGSVAGRMLDAFACLSGSRPVGRTVVPDPAGRGV